MQSLTKRLSSSQDIANAMEQRQALANQKNQNAKSECEIEVHVAVLDVDETRELQEKHTDSNFVFISNLESFYNYRTIGEDFKIVSSVLSLNENYVDVQMKSDEQKDD